MLLASSTSPSLQKFFDRKQSAQRFVRMDFLLQKQALVLNFIAAGAGTVKQKNKCSAPHY